MPETSPTETVMVASFLERPEPGLEVASLPAHLTYVSWFDLPAQQSDRFQETLERVTEETRAPLITGGNLQYFGDKTVRRLDVATKGFNALHDFSAHAALVSFAHHVDPDFKGEFFSLSWSPHVSDTNERAMQQGEEIQLDNLTIIKRDTKMGRKIIQQVFEWGSRNG